MKNKIVLLLGMLCLAGAARAQYSLSGVGASVPAAEINSKPAFQLVSGPPTGLTGTAGKDFAYDFVGQKWYIAKVSGSPATWAQVEELLSFSAGLTRAGQSITCAVASGSVVGCLSTADWTTFNTKLANPFTTTGDLSMSTSGTTGGRLAAGAADTFLQGNGAGVAPSYGTLANCVAAGGVLQYATSTHLFSCHTMALGDLPAGTMLAATYNPTGAGAPSNPCATAGALYRNSSTTPYTVYICPSAAGNWIGPFATYDATKSGAVLLGGLTSGSSGFAAADIAGTAILYVMPTTNGTAGQVLSDSGVTTCPTLAAGMPTVCHQLTFSAAGGGSTSPLTTKGDIWVYGTANARLPVGTNGQALVADSTQTLGVKFASLGTSATGAPYTQSFTGQTSVALTHNLALSPVTAYVLECFDGSGVKIQPGSETATNLNTVTVTFSVAQTGSCTVATGGSGSGSPAVGSITGAGAAGHYPRSNGSIYVDGVIQAGDVPTLNQNTTGTAANVSGTPALPNGVTATTQTAGDNTTKLATTAFVTTAVAGGGGTSAVFAGSTADTIASSATPAFSFAAQSSKSPTVRKFTPVVNVTGPTFTNLTAGARALLYITTDGTHTWSWNSTIADNVCNVWTQSAGTTIAEVFVDPDGATLHGGVCTGGPIGLLSLVTEGATCSSNPASGSLCVWADSTDHTVKAKDSSGNVTVLPRSAGSRTANQFVTHIPSTGIPATAAIVQADLPITTIVQKYFGTAAPGSVSGNLPGDLFTDTTNHHEYVCNAPSGTAAPACTSVATAGWLQVDNSTGAAVTSFNTRTGAVTGAAGDIPETVNAQTGTTYTVVAGDAGKTVTLSNAASIAVTLPQAGGSFPAGWSATLSSIGAGTVTVTPTTSTIGGAATITLEIGEWAKITSDGTNYEVRTNRVTAGSNVTLTKSRAGGVSVASSGGSSGCTVGGSSGDLQKNNGSGGCAAAGLNDNGTAITSSEPISLGTNYLSTTQTAAAGGTTAGLLVAMDTSANMATAATSSVGALGIAVSTQTSGQSVQVATRGIINCVADNSTTIGNLLGVGTTTAGRCRDLGATDSTTVANTIQIIGRARTAVSAAASVSVQLFGPGHYGTKAAIDPATTYFIRDDFGCALATTGNTGCLGWAVTNAGFITSPIATAGAPGLINFATSGTINSVAAITLKASLDQAAAETFDQKWKTGAITGTSPGSNITLRAGLFGSVSSLNPPTDGMYLEKLAADTNWFCVGRASSADTRTDTAVAFSTAAVALEIRRIDSTHIGCKVASTLGGLAAATEVQVSSGLPTANMVTGMMVTNTAAEAKNVLLDYFEMTISGLVR